MLKGIQNFLAVINENWTTIIVIIGLAIALYRKVKNYLTKSNDEKVEIAKAQIREVILKAVADAETDYEEWVKAGSIKRSQVIEEIYEEYPILSKVADQEALTAWIDEAIDTALETLREIVAVNEKEAGADDE